MPTPYEIKFSAFIRLLEDAHDNRLQAVVIPSPQTLGDTYEEIVESLARLSRSGLMLSIVPASVIGH